MWFFSFVLLVNVHEEDEEGDPPSSPAVTNDHKQGSFAPACIKTTTKGFVTVTKAHLSKLNRVF